MADWPTVPLLHEQGGKPPRRLGLAHPSIAPYGVFSSSEGRQSLISIQSDREWVKFAAEFLRRPELETDERRSSNVARGRIEDGRGCGRHFRESRGVTAPSLATNSSSP